MTITPPRSSGLCVLLVLSMAAVAPQGALAATIYVDAANMGLEDGTAVHPFNTIGEGLEGCCPASGSCLCTSPGDTVSVAAGTYIETIVAKSGVDIVGAGADVTTIDGAGDTNAVVSFVGAVGQPRLSGFTITGGVGDVAGYVGTTPITVGGGILIRAANPLITNNVITGNVVSEGYVYGAGIYAQSLNGYLAPKIFDNVITNNDATSTTVTGAGEGGGLYVHVKDGGAVIFGNRFEGNTAADVGGGLRIQADGASSLSVWRNTFIANEAKKGSGMNVVSLATVAVGIDNNLFLQNGSALSAARGGGLWATAGANVVLRVRNNTFYGNSLPVGKGGGAWVESFSGGTGLADLSNNLFSDNVAALGGGIDHESFLGTINNNDFWNNTGGDLYDNGAGGSTLTANLFVDPMLMGPAVGNYRLSALSPCIDTADQTSSPVDDKDKAARPFDGDGDLMAVSDIGAYEYPSGEIFELTFQSQDTFDWQLWPTTGNYNVYRGSLARLKSTGEYTQDPFVEPLADRFCNITGASLPFLDSFVPALSDFVFYVVALKNGVWEGILGTDSFGALRPNDNPCP